MKCTAQKILISVLKDEDKKNDLGLVLPSTTKNVGIERAKVIYVGEEVTTKIDEGAEIYIYGGSGKEFTSPEDNQKYRVISVADIIVIF